MALSTDNSDIYRTATAYEASKETRLVKPEDADRVRADGRAKFYNALMGRYGLPGAAAARMETPVAETAAGARYDLSDMTVTDVLTLAQELTGGANSGASLLGAVSQSDPTQSLIAEYEARLDTLIAEGGDPKAIEGSRNVLNQARLMQAEQALYRSLDAARGDRDDETTGFGGFLNAGIGTADALGPFAAPTALTSLPSSAIALMLTGQG